MYLYIRLELRNRCQIHYKEGKAEVECKNNGKKIAGIVKEERKKREAGKVKQEGKGKNRVKEKDLVESPFCGFP